MYLDKDRRIVRYTLETAVYVCASTVAAGRRVEDSL